MAEYSFQVINSFSEGNKAFTGNPAGVFLEGDSIPDNKVRQKIARQMNLVETVFVAPPREKGDFHFQYFTPLKELPVTGHPTLAGLWALRNDGRLNDKKQISIETAGGILSAWFEEEVVWLTQRPPVFCPIALSMQNVAKAFGLTDKDIDRHHAPEVSNAGLGHITFRVASYDALMQARMDIGELATLCGIVGAREAQLFAIDGKGDYYSRNFCPRLGEEDPACGNGSAALGAWLAKNGALPVGKTLPLLQGHCVNQPCCVFVQRLPDRDNNFNIAIGGTARKMADGQLFV